MTSMTLSLLLTACITTLFCTPFFNDESTHGASEEKTLLQRFNISSKLPEEFTGAVLDGVIGMTADAVSDFVGLTRTSSENQGGCQWFGTAPICFETCPSDFDYIRESHGRCAGSGGGDCTPDPSFGQPCSSLFGYSFKKKFCCKSDPVDCTWSGRWMGAEDAFNYYCRFDSSVGRCGQLHCSVNHKMRKANSSTLIEGAQCDEVSMWDQFGKATCGYIAWSVGGTQVNSWYKTH